MKVNFENMIGIHPVTGTVNTQGSIGQVTVEPFIRGGEAEDAEFWLTVAEKVDEAGCRKLAKVDFESREEVVALANTLLGMLGTDWEIA